MSDSERRSGSSFSMSDPDRMSEEDLVAISDSERRSGSSFSMSDPDRMSEEDLVAKRHLSDDSVDKPFEGHLRPYSSEDSVSPSSSEHKSNGDDEPNYVSKIKIVLITKKKKEDSETTTTTTEEEESESLRTVESLLNNINRMASAIQKEKEESEREKWVEAIMQIYVNNASDQHFGWKPRVDGLLALEKMELVNIICYVVEDIFYHEISLNLADGKLEFKGIPIFIFSLENDKWQKILWDGGGVDDMVNDLCDITVLGALLKKALEVKDEGGDDHNEHNYAAAAAAGDGDENDQGRGDARDDKEEEEEEASAGSTDDKD